MRSTRLGYVATAIVLAALACGPLTTATPPPEGESEVEPVVPTETSPAAAPSPSPEATPTAEQPATPSPTAAEASPFGLLAVQSINKLTPGAAEAFLDSMGLVVSR